MAKALSVFGKISGAVSSVLAFVPGMQPIAAALAINAALMSTGAALLSKPPPARGSVTQVVIASNAEAPYVMGEGYFAGIMRHDIAYGATLKKVPNPYRWMVTVYTTAGPVHSITPYIELAPVSAWYSGFLYTDTQLGACPEASALAPNFAGAPGWPSSAKLSGQAAIGWNLKFDKDGKRYASGVPRQGAYGKWVKVYDPRKDSTFPGGSGAHRLGNEATYEWSENPALHAGTYAFGRYQNGQHIFGIGIPADGIDWVGIAGWANVCDANAWTIFGVIYEPGDRWGNLTDICAAGGGRQVFAQGRLSWLWSAPKVALDTITDADIADENYSVTAMTSWRDRLNSVIPKFRSPDHDWELVPQETAISVPSYITEDGELKQVEWPFNLVKKKNQAAQLAAYKLMDSRELQPITLPCLPRLRRYRPGECLHIFLPELGLDTDAIILSRDFDPARMVVTFTLMGETPGKHAFALGRTGTPPPTPALKQTVEERDNLRWTAMLDQGARTVEYDPLTIYSQGMTARWPDGSTWEYVNATPGSGNPPPIWPATVNAHWSILTPPLDRGKVFVRSIAPTAAESTGGDIWQDDNGRYWIRRADIGLTCNGVPLTCNGVPLTIVWTPTASQPVRDGIDAALATAMAATEAAKLLAQDAQATADGKVQSFYAPTAPSAEGVGDLWFDTDDGNKQYRWSGSAWIAVQDTAIGDALDAAAAADAKADGKVTTFISESSPTAEGDGDLWFKVSTGELRRWSGSAWGDPLVDLTSAAIPRHEPTSAALSFTGSSTGVIEPADQLPETLLIQRFVGSTDVSGDAGTTWAVDYVEGATGATPTVADGELTLPTGLVISPSGALVRVKSERDGFILYTDVTLSQTNAPPNSNGSGTGGTTVNDSTIDGVSTTSLVKVSDTMTVKTGSTGEIAFAGVLSITGAKAVPVGSFGAIARWRYRQLPGGSWTWAGAQIDDTVPLTVTLVSGEPPNPSYFERSLGQINVSRSQTGLTANTDHEIELHAARDSATGTRTISFGGTVTATGK